MLGDGTCLNLFQPQVYCAALIPSLVALKVLLGLGLLSFSALRQEGMDAREAEDAVNDFGRSAVGESKEETVSPCFLIDMRSSIKTARQRRT